MDETDTGADAPAQRPTRPSEATPPDGSGSHTADADPDAGDGCDAAARKRRRGSRSGQRRSKPAGEGAGEIGAGGGNGRAGDDGHPELPEPLREGRASAAAAERAL